MSSSTSNSRKPYAKLLLIIFIIMGSAMGIIRLIMILQGASAHGIMGRVIEARAALPKIVKEKKDLAIVFGSSMVEAGFSAREFDSKLAAKGKNIKSFNFGFGGLNPFFQDYLSRRIKHQFIKNNRKLKLAVIEFNPFQTTTTRWNRAKFIVDSYITMLASDKELWEMTKKDPTRGLRLFTIKYIRGDISAETITSYYGRAIFPVKRPERKKENEEIKKQRNIIGERLGELFKKEYPDYKDSQWSYPWQGAGTIPSERSQETLDLFHQYYKHLQTPERLYNDLQNRIFTADIERLHFEPLLIQSFIRIVKNFQAISENVEVILLPRNTAWVNYTERGKLRLQAAIKQIEDATGVKVVSHQTLEVMKPDMFGDTTHLARYLGDVPYTHFLAGEYAHYFRDDTDSENNK